MKDVVSHRFTLAAPPSLLVLWVFLVGDEPPWAALFAMTAFALSLLLAASRLSRGGAARMAIVVGAVETGPVRRAAATCPGRELP